MREKEKSKTKEKMLCMREKKLREHSVDMLKFKEKMTCY